MAKWIGGAMIKERGAEVDSGDCETDNTRDEWTKYNTCLFLVTNDMITPLYKFYSDNI